MGSRITFLVAAVLMLAGCGASNSSQSSGGAAPSITVLHAGSLNNLLTKGIAPAFQKETGVTIRDEAGGSVALASAIKAQSKTADVFLSADALVNRTLRGPANGDWVSWYTIFLRNSVVLAYSPKSNAAADFEKARTGAMPWYDVLQEPGVKLGRSDPSGDPLGYYSLFLFQLAERHYQVPGLKQKVLGSDDNKEQTAGDFISGLQSGSIDAAPLYVSAMADLGLPYITLPDEINQSNSDMATTYAAASYTNPAGQTFTGVPIGYSATVVRGAKDARSAEAFVAYLLSPAGQTLVKDYHFLPSQGLVGGDKAALPASLQPLIKGEYKEP